MTPARARVVPLAALATAVLAVVSAIVLAGCATGDAAGGSGPSAANAQAQELAFAECMRAHGVPNFPDPNTHAGGAIYLGKPGHPTVDLGSPTFQRAQHTCSPDSGAGSAPQSPTPRLLARLLKGAQCMRRHGIPFPDPTTQLPSGVNFSDPATWQQARIGAIWATNGAYFLFPLQTHPVDQLSAFFKRAEAACGLASY